MWPFKRRDTGDEGPVAAPTPAAEVAQSAAPDPGWRSLEPMAPVMPVVTPLVQRKATVDSLSSWRSPELSLAPLGHALDSEAPSGRLGTAVAEPIHTAAAPGDGTPAIGGAPLSYVQRAPANPTTTVRRWQPPATPMLTSLPPAPPAAPASLVTAPPPPVPSLQLEALAAPAAPPPVAEHEASPTHDASLVGDSDPLSHLAADVPASPAVADDATVQRAPLDLPLAPVQRHADHAHDDGDAADVQRAPIQSQAAPLVGADPLVAPAPPQSSPVAEQAPVASPQPSLDLNAPVQRSARQQRPMGLGRPIASTPSDAVAPPLVARSMPADALPALPAEVQRAAADAPAVEAKEEPVAPLLGSTALRPSLQRSAEPDAPPTADVEGHPADLPLAQRAPEGHAPDMQAAPLVGAEPLVDQTSTTPAAEAPAADDAAPSLPLATPPAVQRAPLQDDGGMLIAPLVSDETHATATSTTGPSTPPPGAAPTAAPSAESPTSDAAVASAPAMPLATPSVQRAANTPMEVSPLLGGRPFAVATVQRASSAPTPSSTSAPGTSTSATADMPLTAAEASAASAAKLSPGPGVYDPVLPIAVWNGAASPVLPSGSGPDAPPGDIVSTVQRSTGVDLSGVRIHRNTGPTVQRMEAKALTHEGDVHLPAERGSLGTTENRSLIAHELVHVAQQRTLGSSRPLEATPAGQQLEMQAQSMEHATANGAPAPDLHLHNHVAPAVQRAAAHAEPATPSPFTPDQVSRLIELASSPAAPAATVQRQAAAEVQRAEPAEAAAAPHAQAAGAHHSDHDLDDLANKLFPRIRSRLRRELRSDRERHGTLTDLHR